MVNHRSAARTCQPPTRGTRTSTGPTSVSTVLARVPLREFPLPLPAGTCLPHPTWSVISPLRESLQWDTRIEIPRLGRRGAHEHSAPHGTDPPLSPLRPDRRTDAHVRAEGSVSRVRACRGTSSNFPYGDCLMWYAMVAEAEALPAAKFQVIFPHLDERQRCLLMGAEARMLGDGGIRLVARAAGVVESTVSRGVSDLDAGVEPLGRARRPGGGRKRAAELDPGLRPALMALSSRMSGVIRCRRCGGRRSRPAAWRPR